MQELLGRISRLDPSASLGLRVIACFDELVVGNVNTRALLAAAASLAGCVAGFQQDDPERSLRVGPKGQLEVGGGAVPQDGAEAPVTVPASEGIVVWLERTGPSLPNDEIILERLALAVRIRHGRGRDQDNRRDLGILLDPAVDEGERAISSAALGLAAGRPYRIVAAPLFAVWERHPQAPEDVVPTVFGPLHALVLPADHPVPEATPCGVGAAALPAHLDHSFRTAVVALRLCDPATAPRVSADDFGGLVSLLADMPPGSPQPDADRIDTLRDHGWVAPTVDAVVRSSSLRHAARLADVHHSTMQARVDVLSEALGFDPYDGLGRARLGVAYLTCRLRSSRVLDLPAPQV